MIMESGVSAGIGIMTIFGITVYGRAAQACFDAKKLNAHSEDDVMVY